MEASNTTPAAILNADIRRRKILVFCPIGLGNYLMATPALELLRRELDSLHLLALKPGIRDMALASGWFEQVHIWDPDEDGLLAGIRLLSRLRKMAFSVSISLFPSGHAKFAAFSLLAGARLRVGFNYPHSRWAGLVQHRSLRVRTGLHDTEQNMALAAACLGIPAPTPGPLHFSMAARGPDTGDLKGRPFVACHPGSSTQRGMLAKRWPPERFAGLARRLHAHFGVQTVLLGGPEEEDLRRQIRATAESAVRDVSTPDLPATAAILRQAAFYLGNDSGLMHLAVAMGTRCAVFFGPSDETRTGPWFLEGTVEPSPAGGNPVSRGHCLLCAPMRKEHRVTDNPRARHKGFRDLRDLSEEAAWEQLEPFAARLLR